MFKELTLMLRLLEQVLKELKTSNEIQKQLQEEISQNTKCMKALLIHVQALRDASETSGSPTEGNIYRGNGGSSHTGDCKKKAEESGDCRSKCNGKCD